MADKEMGEGEGRKGKPNLPELLKSDDVTRNHKKDSIISKEQMSDKYQQVYNNAWNAVRKNNFKQFKTTVGNLIKFSIDSLAASAPLDVHCTKAKITFNDPETKIEHHMCLLAWCGFHGRLEFARHLIQNGASVDCGNYLVGSPLLQMMVFHDARPGATPLSLEILRFFVEENRSVLSRIISTNDNTLHNATALTIALHMKRVDIAQYLYSEHKLHPVLCGSLDYPPLFIEYIEYGTFEFIPWLLTEGFKRGAEIVRFIDEVSQPEILEAGLESGEVKESSLMEAARRNDRLVAHAMLLCANQQGVNLFTKKRPDLINAVDSRGRTALYIAAEMGIKKAVNILSNNSRCEALLNMGGSQPLIAAAKAGHKSSVERLLFHTLKEDALSNRPMVVEQIRLASVTALTYGYQTYFEGFHCNDMRAYELKALNLMLDDSGNRAAHMAALKGREDIFKAIISTTIPEMIALLTVRNHDGKTPLQLAVDKGHSGIFKTLPTKNTEFREAWKKFNDALLLYSCYHGNVETVNAIMNLNSSAHIRSPKGRTPLSCAAEAGNDEVVGYLLTCKHASSDGTVVRPCTEGSGVPEWNPLLLAASNGHAKVCRRLLDKRASVNGPRCPKTNFTPLMVAIDSGHREVVITILSDETQGTEAMRVCVERKNKGEEVEIITPMRMLIKEMPDVAEWMMDLSIHTVDENEEREALSEEGSDTAIEYSFQFLEDFQEEYPIIPFSNWKIFKSLFMDSSSHRRIYNVSPDLPALSLDNGSNEKIIVSDDDDDDDKKSDTQQEAESTMITSPCGTFDSEGLEYFDPATNMDNIFDAPFCPSLDEVTEAECPVRMHSDRDNDWGPTQYNRNHHPLHIMVAHKRVELLRHPLVMRLLDYKWRKVALPLFVAYITVYLIFLLMLTLFAVLSPRPSPQSQTCVMNSRVADVMPQMSNGTCNAIDPGTVDYLYGSSVFIILISLIYLLVELVQLVRRKKQYLTEGENYVQVLTFVLSIIFVSGFSNECWCAPSWQWQFGALALFLAWFNLIILLKDLPFTGIPINMLFNICLTFVGLLFLPVLLIISFSLPFYMLFVRDLEAFEGENGILRAFESPSRSLAKTIMQTAGELDFSNIFNSGELLYSPTTYILFITFVVIMPILFSNLLVGLAVGDTAEEKDKAAFTRTRLQVEFILELESLSAFLRGRMRPEHNRRRYGKKDTRLHQLYQRLVGLDYHEQMEMVKDLRDKDEDFVNAALKEKGPTHELQVKVGGLSVKTVKVEEDVRAAREEIAGVEGRVGERLEKVEKSISEVKTLLEQLIISKTSSSED